MFWEELEAVWVMLPEILLIVKGEAVPLTPVFLLNSTPITVLHLEIMTSLVTIAQFK
jgi:hypothetical protein